MARRALLALAVMLSASAACSAVPDLTFGESDGGDAGPCVTTGAEVCDDGIDNDCNGKIDCADDACQAKYRCVDRAPDDWQLTAFVQSSRPGCPDGFGDSTDVRAVRAGSGSCGCDCGGASACDPNGIVAGIGDDPSCAATTKTFDARSDCQRLDGAGLPISGNAFVKATAGTATSCKGSANGSVPEVRDARTCAVRRTGGGCDGGQACVRRASDGYSVCVAKDGNQSCPGSYPTSVHAGTNVQQDSRSCGACTCTTAPCTGEVKLYDNRDCKDGEKLKLSARAQSGNCTRGSNGPFQARGYTATVEGGCVMGAAGAASGTLSFENERTICCK